MDYLDLIEKYKIVFDAKPNAVPYNYRISYKVSQVCFIIYKSSGSKRGCSLLKIHMVSFALSSNDAKDKLIDFVHKEFKDPPIIRLDPAVDKAVAFAIADEFIEMSQNGKYLLTPKGIALVAQIDKEPGLFVAEKWTCQEMCSHKIPKILDRQISGGVMRELL